MNEKMQKQTFLKMTISLITVVIAIVSSVCLVFAAGPNKEAEKSDISLVPGVNNAYVVFGETITENNITFHDGIKKDITDSNDSLYSEQVEIDGVAARKVYKENKVRFTVDSSYYSKGDSDFVILITFYDFGPERGTFNILYPNNQGKTSSKTIEKPGVTPQWRTSRVLIDDAKFGQDGNYDIEITTGLYNAFAKFELVNLSAAVRNESAVDIGAVNIVQAQALSAIGLYDGKDENMAETLTREETTGMFAKIINEDENYLKKEYICSFNDVSEDYRSYVGYIESLGIIKGGGDGIFEAKREMSIGEYLTVFLRYLGYNDEEFSKDIIAFSDIIGLMERENLIYSEKLMLTRDVFVIISYNGGRLNDKNTGKSLFERLVTCGKITKEQLEATSLQDMLAYKYVIPFKVPKKEIYDSTSGRTYYYVNFDGDAIHRNYFNKQEFNDEGTKFIFGNPTTGGMYEYDIETEMMRFLDTCYVEDSLWATVAPGNKIYYYKTAQEIWYMDWDTGEKRKLTGPPEGLELIGHVCPTNDGKYFSVKIARGSQADDLPDGSFNFYRMARYNIETSEWTLQRHTFKCLPGGSIGHPIINPVYPDLIFFCHDGDASWMPDRIHLMDYNKGIDYNLFVQGKKADGGVAEKPGHEIWSYNGENLYFISYPGSRHTGVTRVSKDGLEREYYGDGEYSTWHSNVTADERWVCADTNDSPRKIVLVSTETYDAEVLAAFYETAGSHPYQPHPSFSWNGEKIMWQAKQDGVLGACWMDISDLTSRKYNGGRKQYNDDLEIVTYKAHETETPLTEENDETILTSKVQTGIYFNINDDKIRTQNGKVKIKFEYFDNSRLPINVVYTRAYINDVDFGMREDKVISLQRNNTKKWLEAEVVIDNANMINGVSYRTDFYITGGMSGAKVKNVEVVEIQDYNQSVENRPAIN